MHSFARDLMTCLDVTQRSSGSGGVKTLEQAVSTLRVSASDGCVAGNFNIGDGTAALFRFFPATAEKRATAVSRESNRRHGLSAVPRTHLVTADFRFPVKARPPGDLLERREDCSGFRLRLA